MQPAEQRSGRPSEHPAEQLTGRPKMRRRTAEQQAEQAAVQPAERRSGRPSEQPAEQPTGRPKRRRTAEQQAEQDAGVVQRPQDAVQPAEQGAERPSEHPAEQPAEERKRKRAARPPKLPSVQSVKEESFTPEEQEDLNALLKIYNTPSELTRKGPTRDLFKPEKRIEKYKETYKNFRIAEKRRPKDKKTMLFILRRIRQFELEQNIPHDEFDESIRSYFEPTDPGHNAIAQCPVKALADVETPPRLTEPPSQPHLELDEQPSEQPVMPINEQPAEQTAEKSAGQSAEQLVAQPADPPPEAPAGSPARPPAELVEAEPAAAEPAAAELAAELAAESAAESAAEPAAELAAEPPAEPAADEGVEPAVQPARASILQRDDEMNVLVVLRAFQTFPVGLALDELVREVWRIGRPFARKSLRETDAMVRAVVDGLEDEDQCVVMNGIISFVEI